MTRTTNPETQRSIPGDLKPQLHYCANLKCCNIMWPCMPYINPRAIRIRCRVTFCMRSKVNAMCSRARITHNRALEGSAVTELLIWSICKSDYCGSPISLLTGHASLSSQLYSDKRYKIHDYEKWTLRPYIFKFW